MARHALSRSLPLIPIVLAALRLGGCVSQPSEPTGASSDPLPYLGEPPLSPPPDTTRLAGGASSFTYLEEVYEGGQRKDDKTSIITWKASRGERDSAHADSTRWRMDIVADAPDHLTSDDPVPMTLLYRNNGDVIMQRYVRSHYASGIADMVIPLSTHADVELPYQHSIYHNVARHHEGDFSITRTTTCRYLGRDTIDATGERMACEHGMTVLTFYAHPGAEKYPIAGSDPYHIYVIEYWFAPKIGFIAKEKVYPSTLGGTMGSSSWMERTLRSYELR
jgi:hypothetical protein